MCGIFGITDNKEASRLTYIGLFALQHRGQESAGIASESNRKLVYYNSMGLVNEVFNESIIAGLKGRNSIGHVRYSTTGSSDVSNAQPLYFNSKFGEIALSHNGNIINSGELKAELRNLGAIFQSTTDSEIIVHLISRHKSHDLIEALKENLPKLKGSYSFLFLTKKELIAARDPYGFRPLFYGKKDNSYVFASETCAIDAVKAKLIGEIEPGEIAVARAGKLKKIRFSNSKKYSRCIFEQVYFARPDSFFCGYSVQSARYEIGRLLAMEYNIKADIVSGVPDSGTAYALGFSKQANIEYKTVFMRNRYSQRSFIQPKQSAREFTAEMKLSPIKDVIKGNSLILIDDSLVRGTTSQKIVKSLKDCGAKKVIMLIASPPVKFPCVYGIDTARKEELIANKLSIKEICKFIGADELHYLSLDNLINGCGRGDINFCHACFSGNYPEK
jgi:amidophosphoribosyltransferase